MDLLRVALFSLALFGLWFVCCRHLSAEWSFNEQYNYGWFVPFFAAYLFWLRWSERPAEQAPGRRTTLLTVFGIIGLVLLFPVRLLEIGNPDWRLLSWLHALDVVALTLVSIWCLGGKSWLRHFAFPVVFLLVAVPWPSAIESRLIQGLMPTVASIATETLALLGIPAEVQGNVIRVGGGLLGVNEACSGVRSLQTAIMIGLLLGEVKRLSILRRVLLVLGAVAISFIANCARTFFLVWMAATRGVNESEHWHDLAGYLIVALVFVGTMAFAALLAARQISEAGEEVQPGTANRSPSYTLLPLGVLISTVAWLVAIEIGAEWWYRIHETNLRTSARWSVRWPENAPEFRTLRIDDRTRTILRFDEGRGAIWREPADEAQSMTELATDDSRRLLYFFRWQPGHNSALLANLHRPDVCLPATGWRQLADHGVRVYQVSADLRIPFRHFEFGRDVNGRTQFAQAFYCLWEDRIDENPGQAEAGEASAWTRAERVDAVLKGRRHLGQRVLEYLVLDSRSSSPIEAENAFAASIKNLIAPPPH